MALKWNVTFKVDGRQQEWQRFGRDFSEVRTSAHQAIKREWPVQKISNLRVTFAGGH